MVRGRRALSPSRPGPVQLLAADALAAYQPRKPARARRELARRRGALVRTPGDGTGAADPAASDVRAVPGARRRAEKPGRRVAHGAIPCGRRHADRLASG